MKSTNLRKHKHVYSCVLILEEMLQTAEDMLEDATMILSQAKGAERGEVVGVSCSRAIQIVGGKSWVPMVTISWVPVGVVGVVGAKSCHNLVGAKSCNNSKGAKSCPCFLIFPVRFKAHINGGSCNSSFRKCLRRWPGHHVWKCNS